MTSILSQDVAQFFFISREYEMFPSLTIWMKNRYLARIIRYFNWQAFVTYSLTSDEID